MSERRSYFRIDESIALEFKVVDEITANTAVPELQFPKTASLQLFNDLRKIDQDNSHLLHLIKEDSRSLGEYLMNLNRKIDLISQQLMNDYKPLPPSQSIKQVNLSEGGIAFGSTEPVKANDYIVIRMVFLPSNAGLVLFGKVIRAEPSSKGEYQLAVRFHRINDAQQHLIGQHIMRTQMAEKRSKKAHLF